MIEASDIRVRHNSEVHNHDKAELGRLTRTLDAVVHGFESLHLNLLEASQSAQITTEELQPRIRFHLHGALGGLRKTLEHGFFSAWDEVQDRSLNLLAQGYYEVISAYDESIKQLSFTSTTETIMRKVIYFSIENKLSAKMELAIEAVNKLTNMVYYPLLNAESAVEYTVTPDKRYDRTLIPYEILAHCSDQLKEYFNGLSENIGEVMSALLQLKNVVKDVYNTNILNETANTEGRRKFIDHSSQIITFLALFRNKIIEKSRETVESKMDKVKKLNHTMVSLTSDIVKELTLRQQLGARYKIAYDSILNFAKNAQVYRSEGSVGKSGVARSGLSKSTMQGFMELNTIHTELISHSKELSEIWKRFKSVLISIWRSFLLDTSVRDFYMQLYNDITDMKNHPSEIPRLKAIFTHPKMLDISAEDAISLQPDDFYALLNADAAVIGMESQISSIEKLANDLQRWTDVDIVFEDNVKELIESYEELKEDLSEYQKTITLDKKYFRYVETRYL